jgi:predicted permease
VSQPAWRRYLRFHGPDIAADVDEELRFHVDARVQEYLAMGMSPDDARAEALRRFGDVNEVRERCQVIDQLNEQDRRRADMWEALRQDMRYAFRALRRSPAFTAIAVLTLALGIGANTAIFSVINGVLLQPLPYHEPDRLVRLFTAFRGSGEERYAMSQPEFMDYKGLTHVFENAAAYRGAPLTLTGSGEPQRVRGIAATRDFFPVLGITPQRGRAFEGEDGRAGHEPLVLVTHEFWQNRFGGDSALLGRSLTLNGVARRVIGILPAGALYQQAEVFIPFFINPDSMTGRATNYLSGVARLRPGITVTQAQRELNALTQRLQQEYARTYPASMGFGATVVSLHEEIVGDVRPALLVLLGVVGLVLLIACANVANLLLARGEARQREIAVRLALGAGRARIIRQLLTESSVLALLGATAGVLLAWLGMKSLLAVDPAVIPRIELVRIDTTVALVTLGVALLTGVLFGLAPAMLLARPPAQASLKEGARGASIGGSQQRLGRMLVIGEVALAVVVVIGAGLLIRSFRALQNVDPGFRPENVLAVDLDVPSTRYDVEATTVFYQQLIERLAALPGVSVVGAASDLPLVSGGSNWDIDIAGRVVPPGQADPSPNVRGVTEGYFRALSLRVVKGRLFGPQDTRTSAPVAVINETLARTVWPGADPIGQQVRFDTKRPWITIVGIVNDVRSFGLDEPTPTELFLLHGQMPVVAGSTERAMYVVLKTAGDPVALTGPARQAVNDADPLLAIIGIRTMTEMVVGSVARPRFTMLLLGLFGAVALVLSAIGIYGMISYGVKRRTREIGIRLALGARPADVQRLVVGQGMRLALSGLAIGVVGALAARKIMDRLLFGVSATDPVTFVAITLLLALVAFVASWIPARRAIATDATTSLRTE